MNYFSKAIRTLARFKRKLKDLVTFKKDGLTKKEREEELRVLDEFNTM